MKRKGTDWGRVFSICIFNKGLTARVCGEKESNRVRYT